MEKRFFHHDEALLSANPDFADRTLPSLDARVEIASAAVPELAAAAASKAIAEWGRPATDITHLVFSTYSGARAPSADLRLASLLGLRASVSRTVLSLHGCYGGARSLQLAKEIAENNRGARVLVACSDLTLIGFYGPEAGCLDTIVGQGLFGDGAGAVIVGADPVGPTERAIFEMVHATQATVPGTEDAITMQLMKGGLDFHISDQVPKLLGASIERCLLDAFGSLGMSGVKWNELFWALHPGGRAILDRIEGVLGAGRREARGEPAGDKLRWMLIMPSSVFDHRFAKSRNITNHIKILGFTMKDNSLYGYLLKAAATETAMGSAPANVREFWRTQRADGPAAVLAIGTSNPTNCVLQDEFPDFYFRATKSEHLVGLKEKFKRICQKLGRGEALPAPHGGAASARTRSSSTTTRRRWTRGWTSSRPPCRSSPRRPPGRRSPSGAARPPTSPTSSSPPTPARTSRASTSSWSLSSASAPPCAAPCSNLNGCFAGAAALRVAKDLAENNRGARVLVVCAELTVLLFARPEEGCFQTLINQGLFGDGAGAVIVGAAADDDPAMAAGERPLFEIVSAAQAIVPESESFIEMHLTRGGYDGNISVREVPVLIGDNIERCLMDAFEPLGDIVGAGWKWNDMFWDVHPGSSAILDKVDDVLQLKPEKLAASRRVLSEYGNMFGVTVIFVLDELRRRMEKGEEVGEPEWGLMVAFGPGLTVETMVLRRCVEQGTGGASEEEEKTDWGLRGRMRGCNKFVLDLDHVSMHVGIA
ncbi:hypothetical protein HU200_034240 [Digitaria exilis]|uniref:Chalcone synthase n=1 Tax=Digitaria exilis TaxID=1010633 RepID=A0A835EMA9_9POAL|nr:hypothetical protein HU200_034240 [Digitaria exilis]